MRQIEVHRLNQSARSLVSQNNHTLAQLTRFTKIANSVTEYNCPKLIIKTKSSIAANCSVTND